MFSSVYTGCYSRDGQECGYAVKVSRIETGKEQRGLEEVAISMAMGELGVAPTVFDAWLCPEAPKTRRRGPYIFIVMTKLDKSLPLWEDVQKQEHLVSLDSLEQLGLDVAQRIRAMHDAGVVHNDLHAANILIQRTNASAPPRAWIIDFGRATVRKRLPVIARQRDAKIPLELLHHVLQTRVQALSDTLAEQV